MEDFEDIIGFEGLYQINRNGEVYSIKRKLLMKPTINSHGYLTLGLRKNNKYNYKKIHLLLANQFIENPNNYDLIDHIDKIKTNNNLENLRWIDYSGNNRNRAKYKNNNYPIGVRKNGNKFTARITINKKDKHLGTFNTIEDASLAYQNEYKKQMCNY